MLGIKLNDVGWTLGIITLNNTVIIQFVAVQKRCQGTSTYSSNFTSVPVLKILYIMDINKCRAN